MSGDGHAEFAFRGGHRELLHGITREDVGWMCERLARLTDRQWEEAFAAAGQPPDVAARFIAKLHQKIDEGRAFAREKGGGTR